MYTEASAQFSAKSMTEYGELAAFAEFRAQSNNTWQGSDRHWAYLDSAYLKLGALLAGSTASARIWATRRMTNTACRTSSAR
jgi:hypothetical protein